MNIRLLAVTAIAFVAGVAGFNFLLLNMAEAKPDLLTVQGECDLSHSPCLAKDQLGHEVRFSLSPRPVPLLEDVVVDASVMGMDSVRVAQVSIEGLSMYMGVQIIPLALAGAGSDSGQRLTGTLQLPVCTSRTMEWGATLMIQTNAKQYEVTYPFTTVVP